MGRGCLPAPKPCWADAPRSVAVGTGRQWKDPRTSIEALRHQHKDSIDRFHLPYFAP